MPTPQTARLAETPQRNPDNEKRPWLMKARIASDAPCASMHFPQFGGQFSVRIAVEGP